MELASTLNGMVSIFSVHNSLLGYNSYSWRCLCQVVRETTVLLLMLTVALTGCLIPIFLYIQVYGENGTHCMFVNWN